MLAANLLFCLKGFKGSKLPEGGINVFASLPHTHLTGRKIFLRHIRNEVELPEITKDYHYDFNFQEVQTLPKEVHIAPGDALINVCVYDSTDRNDFTRGGLGTRDEMCLSFLFYYPKVNTSSCLSSEQPARQKWNEQYVKQNYELLGKPTFWNETVDKGLKETYRETKTVLSFCVDKANLVYGVSPKPVIKKPYQTESICKEVSMATNVVPGVTGTSEDSSLSPATTSNAGTTNKEVMMVIVITPFILVIGSLVTQP
ncbi:DBH-like monooxygenase protein 2 homolog [Montipora capricornis]|uniref:DBH-like monooxygenase protein 2 homolog n=1 Tax=Montipora capricornis TaxID=246305 RepID=UPI0035F173B4